MSITLSDSARVLLSAASQHEIGFANPGSLKIPAAARTSVIKGLVKRHLLTEIDAPKAYIGLAWRQDEQGTHVVAKITDEGLRAIGIDPNEGDAQAGEPDCSGIEGSVPDTAPAGADDATEGDAPAEEAEPAQGVPTPAPRASLRDAAAAVLAAWDASPAQDATDNPISRAIEALRAALAGKPARAPREPGAPRKPREGTKQETVLAMLRRPEGATVAQIAEATGWQQHTVRGFFAGMKKKGIDVASAKAAKTATAAAHTIYSID